MIDIIRCYSISSVNVLVACEDEEIGGRVNDALKIISPYRSQRPFEVMMP